MEKQKRREILMDFQTGFPKGTPKQMVIQRGKYWRMVIPMD
jgi:hypothetical protein